MSIKKLLHRKFNNHIAIIIPTKNTTDTVKKIMAGIGSSNLTIFSDNWEDYYYNVPCKYVSNDFDEKYVTYIVDRRKKAKEEGKKISQHYVVFDDILVSQSTTIKSSPIINYIIKEGQNIGITFIFATHTSLILDNRFRISVGLVFTGQTVKPRELDRIRLYFGGNANTKDFRNKIKKLGDKELSFVDRTRRGDNKYVYKTITL